jgi:hypothetical protein
MSADWDGTFDFQSEGNSMRFQVMAISQIKPSPRNARTHSAKQIRQIADSIYTFGFTSPLLVSEDGELIAGHGRYQAAKSLGIGMVPVVIVGGLSPAKRRALAIADNRIAENAGWDRARLAIEIPELSDLLSAEGLDVSVLGFEPVEIEHLQTKFERTAPPRNNDAIDPAWGEAPTVSRPGDLCVLGNHKLLCGDVRSADLACLMTGCRADMAFLDPPRSELTGPSAFAVADGDMSSRDSVRFLSRAFDAAASVSREGAIHLVCTDWRCIPELIAAAEPTYGEAVDVAVREKSEADPGFLYRSELEFIFVFGIPPLNIATGGPKRSRSNIWHYRDVKASGRRDGVRLPPAGKPVGFIADVLKDCTGQGHIVLDLFAGVGTTVMAAERLGRHARALEVEPRLVDVAIRRWQTFARADALHAESGLSFDDIAAGRRLSAGRSPHQSEI